MQRNLHKSSPSLVRPISKPYGELRTLQRTFWYKMIFGLGCLFIWDLGVSFKNVMTSVTTLYTYDEKNRVMVRIIKKAMILDVLWQITLFDDFWSQIIHENQNSAKRLSKNALFSQIEIFWNFLKKSEI